MADQLVTYELDGAVAVIGLNRAEKRNAVNDALMAQLREERWPEHPSHLGKPGPGTGSRHCKADATDRRRVLVAHGHAGSSTPSIRLTASAALLFLFRYLLQPEA